MTSYAPHPAAPPARRDRSLLPAALVSLVATSLALGSSLLLFTWYLDAWEAGLGPNQDSAFGGLVYLLAVPLVVPILLALVAVLVSAAGWAAARGILVATVLLSLVGTLGYALMTVAGLAHLDEPGAGEGLLATLVPALILLVPALAYRRATRLT